MVGLMEERGGEGRYLMELRVGVRKWAVLRVGFPPVGETIGASRSSIRASAAAESSSTIAIARGSGFLVLSCFVVGIKGKK